MRTLKKVLIILSSLGFLLVLIGLITPGWVLLDADLIEMAALQMKKMPVQVQQQYKALQQQQAEILKQHPEIPVPKDFSMRCGPFFIKYCMGMVTRGIYGDICVVISPGAIITMFDMIARNTTKGNNNQVANMIASIQSSGWTVASLIRVYVAIIVICALVLIQSFVSLVLTIVYVCIKHPRKRFGIAGSVSSFLSGSIIVLIILFVLIVHGKAVSVGKESFGDAGSLGFPYSTVLCFIGCVLIIVNAVILTRITLKSKEPFKYEMMVIDTSKGSGGTYVAKT